MSQLTRRTFVKSAAAGALLATASAKAAPNDRIRHAIIGVGGQGRAHARTFAAHPGCEVIALCDVDPAQREKAAEEIRAHANPESIEDYRRILDNSDIDSVSIVTPDHWHTPIALAALDAGKHVYVEKPCCHNIREGQRLRAAAAQSGKCVQHGTHSRSGQGIRDAVNWLREGHLGKVRLAKAINHQLRGPIGRAPETAPPRGVNYDLWLGPAPEHPFTQNRWHYNWHWFWDYGTGDLGNDGIHQVDVARWGLGVNYPNAVTASGGQLFYDDDHQTPDTQVVTYEYDDCYLLYEMRLWTKYPLEGHDNGVVFYGDNGIFEVGRNGCEVTLTGEPKKKIGGGSDFPGNIANYIEAVKANDPKKLNAPIDEGVASSVLCHLGNIATRTGTRLEFDAQTFQIPNNEEAQKLLTRTYRKGYEI